MRVSSVIVSYPISPNTMTSFANHFAKLNSFNSRHSEIPIDQQSLEVENKLGFRHLLGQIFGKGNIFGYTLTIINRLHLMYYFLGEFYVCNVFANTTRWSWILFNSVNGTMLLMQCLSCVFSKSNHEITKILYNVQIVITVAYYLIIIPAITCINRNHTAQALKILDKKYHLQSRSSFDDSLIPTRPKHHAVGIISISVIIQVFLMCIYCTVTEMHIIFGHTKDDLKNSNNYLYPVYCDYVDTLTEYLILSCSQMIFSMPTLGSPYLIPLFVILSADRFYNKFEEISDAIKCNSKNFADRYEQLLNESYDTKQIKIQKRELVLEFTKDIHHYARLHHDLLRGINHLKFYLQSSISISLAMFLFIDVVLFYIFILYKDESFLLRMKILTFAFGMANILFVNCAAGNLFADMGEMFKDSVYNMPWYYLPSLSRKSVNLLLYQAQVTIGFKALKIFPINMELFDRFCRNVYSAASVLGGYQKTH